MPTTTSLYCKRLVYAKTGGHCWYCGVELDFSGKCNSNPRAACIDHANPQNNGGGNHLSNLLPCCWLCNSKKHKKSVEEFRFWLMLKASGNWRASKLLRESLTECQTPFDSSILQAIEWLEAQVEPIVFWAEQNHL